MWQKAGGWAVAAFLAGMAALILSVNAFAWHGGLIRFSSLAFSGDEPHYLMVVNSLLQDHDLDLADDYRRVAQGSFEAGRRFRFAPLDHHTLLVDRERGVSKLWQEVFDWRVRECREPGCEGFRRLTHDFPPGQPRAEISAHPLPFPALLALALAPFRPAPQDVEPEVSRVIQLLCWLGVLLTYLAARAAGFGQWEGLLAAALLGLASPWLAYSRSFFVDLPAGVFLILGIWALHRGRPGIAGLAAGLAFAVKPLFVLFGLGWMLERWFAGQRGQAIRLAIPLGAVGLAVGMVNELAARRLIIFGTSPWRWALGLNGLHAHLFDAGHGLLPFAPWALLALAPLVTALISRDASPLMRQVAFPCVPYFAILFASAYLGETCYGPRYWVSLLPLLALLVLEAGRTARLPRLQLFCVAVLGTLGLYIALPAALRYPELWDRGALAAWND